MKFNKKKIILVSVSWTVIGSKTKDEVAFKFSPPLGLAYLASSIKNAGHDVEIIDGLALDWQRREYKNDVVTYGIPIEELVEIVAKKNPDVIGLSCLFTTQYPNNEKFAKLIRKKCPNAKIIIGGAHASALPVQIINTKLYDYLVIEEGEDTIIELLENLNSSIDKLKKVKGIFFFDGEKRVFTGIRNPIIPMDKIPFPAYDMLQLDAYFNSWKKSGRTVYNKKWCSIITSRGCPYKCVFCSIHPVYGRAWRGFSPNRVVDEIEYLYKKYDIEEFLFEDDNLTFNKNRAKEIFKEMIKRGLNKDKICWTSPNGLRADTLDDELMFLFKETGARYIRVACESADQSVIDNIIHKDIKVKDIENAVKLAHKWKIPIGVFFVIGFPGETLENIHTTVNYAKYLLKKYDARPLIFYACPLPGTDLLPLCIEKNYLVREPTPNNYMKAIWVPDGVEPEPMIQTEEFGPNDLIKIRNEYSQWEKRYDFKKNPIKKIGIGAIVKFKKLVGNINY